MPTITLSTDTKDSVLNALKAKIDSGGAAGSIKIWYPHSLPFACPEA